MRLTLKGWSLFYIGCRRVVGRLRQSSASLHPPSGTSFLRGPLTRPRPAMLCRSLPATTQLFPGAVRAEISPADNSGDVQLSPARHGITHRSCRFPGDLWAGESPCYASCFSRSLVCQHLRAEKNRRCHFLVTKRPQLKRYPDSSNYIFENLFGTISSSQGGRVYSQSRSGCRIGRAQFLELHYVQH